MTSPLDGELNRQLVVAPVTAPKGLVATLGSPEPPKGGVSGTLSLPIATTDRALRTATATAASSMTKLPNEHLDQL